MIVYLPNLFDPTRRQLRRLVTPMPLRAGVESLGLDWRRQAIVALVNGRPVLRADWGRLVGPDDQVVLFDAGDLPAGGGGSNPLRTVLMLAVTLWAGPAAAGLMGFAQGTLGYALVSGAVSLVGTALVNSLLPPSGMPALHGANVPAASPTYSIQAQGNVARLGAPIPVVYGRLRVYPYYAAQPYTEYIDNEQFLYSLLVVGQGDYAISSGDIWIEDTPIDHFSDVRYEVLPPGTAPTVVPHHVTPSGEVSGQRLDGVATRWVEDGAAETVGVSGTGERLVSNGGQLPVETVTQIELQLMWGGSGELLGGSIDIYATEVDAAGQVVGQEFLLAQVSALFALTIQPKTYRYDVTPARYRVRLVRTDSAGVGTITLLRVRGKLSETAAYTGPFSACPPGSTCEAIGVDLVMPKGLYYAGDAGNLLSMSVRCTFEARPIDDLGAPQGGWFVLGTETVSAATTTPQRRSYRYPVTPARYEVRAVRLDEEDLSARAGHVCLWGGLRGYVGPTVADDGITRLAVRIRASDQLNAQTARRINLVAKRKLPHWDPVAGWSAPTETRSIAWAIADMLRNPVYGAGLSDRAIDLPALHALDQVWSARGDHFDAQYDQPDTFWRALTLACRAGRAMPFRQGGRVSVVRDQPQDQAVCLYSMRNIVRGSFSVEYLMPTEETADAVIAEYWDAVKWAPDEVLCVPPGSPGNHPVRQQFFGIVDREQARREGLHTAAASLWRRRIIRFTTEMEGLIPSLGDLVLVSHDMPQWGQSGEVVGYDAASATLTLSEPLVWRDGQAHYLGLNDRDGSVLTVVAVQPGTQPNQVVLTEPLPAGWMPATGTDRERTFYAFGPGETYGLAALVRSVRPRGEALVELELVNDDARVHAADGYATPAYEPDPAELDHAAAGLGASLYDLLQRIGGAEPATIRFRYWPDRPADAQGRSVFIFDHPIVVPDNIHVEIQEGAVLQFNQGASTQGALILGTGGLAVPMGAAAVPVFDDRTAFNNAVWWPAATLNIASPTWWGATGDGSDASAQIASALYVLSEGGTLDFPGGHFLIQGNNPATNAIIDIPSNVVIRGAGMDVTFIDINTAPNIAAFQAKKTDGVQVLDLTFQGLPGTPADARALKFTSSANVVVDRVKCVDIPDGIRFSDTQFTVGTVIVVDNSATNSATMLKGIKVYGPSTGTIADFQATGRFTNNCLEIEQGRDASAWAANTAYAVGNLVIPTSNPTFIWRCVTAGTSGATEPNWSLADASGLVTDGAVVWEQDAAYGRPHDITINRYAVANLVEPLRLREVDNLTLLNGTATDAGYETGTTAGNGNVLFDVRRATNVTINGLTVRNAAAAPDLAKVYETDGFLLDNADVCGVDRGVRLKSLTGYGPSNNVRLTSNVLMNCGKAKTDPTYTSPDSKRCQVLDGSTNVSDLSDLNTGCP